MRAHKLTSQVKDPQKFIANKGEYIVKNFKLPTIAQKSALGSQPLAQNLHSYYKQKDWGGAIILDTNEVVFDADNQESANAFHALLATHDIHDYFYVNTKKGAHFYFEIDSPKEPITVRRTKSNSLSLQNIESKPVVFDILGKDSLVFAGGAFDFYYKPANEHPVYKLSLEQYYDLMHALCSKDTEQRLIHKAGKYRRASYNKPLANFVREVITAGTLDRLPSGYENFKGFFFSKQPENLSVFTPLGTDTKLLKGVIGRNNLLFSIMLDCIRTCALEGDETLAFLQIIDNDIFDVSLQDDNEFHGSFNASTIAKKSEFYLHHDKLKEEEGWLTRRDIFIDVTPHRRTPGNYIQIEIDEDDNIICQEIRSKETLENYIFDSEYYINKYTQPVKEGSDIRRLKSTTCLKRMLRSTALHRDITRTVFRYNKHNELIVDEGLRGLNAWVRNPNTLPYVTRDDFYHHPFFKVIENVMPNKSVRNKFFADLKLVLTKGLPVQNVAIFAGPGKIGKDTFMDFISHCITDGSSGSTYKRDISSERNNRWDAYVAQARVVIFNEDGGGEGVNTPFLKKLNKLVRNNSYSGELKGQDFRDFEIVTTCLMIATNDLGVTFEGYNNTRAYISRGYAQTDLEAEWDNLFGNKSRNDVYKEYAPIFMSYILNSDEFVEAAQGLSKDYSQWDDSAAAQEYKQAISDDDGANFTAIQHIMHSVQQQDFRLLHELASGKPISEEYQVEGIVDKSTREFAARIYSLILYKFNEGNLPAPPHWYYNKKDNRMGQIIKCARMAVRLDRANSMSLSVYERKKQVNDSLVGILQFLERYFYDNAKCSMAITAYRASPNYLKPLKGFNLDKEGLLTNSNHISKEEDDE